jgi:hypothetical protein
MSIPKQIRAWDNSGGDWDVHTLIPLASAAGEFSSNFSRPNRIGDLGFIRSDYLGGAPTYSRNLITAPFEMIRPHTSR